MRLNVKLYAGLSPYLPAAASANTAELDVTENTTPADIISRLNLPLELVHIVLLNGVYIQPEDRGSTSLKEGDTLSMWPPVAGG
ncbi:MAG: MoaD/ThiS family protein [Gammaproteobacteria bacterium]|jgi:molybdopterin synthase sulfur carrier subunit